MTRTERSWGQYLLFDARREERNGVMVFRSTACWRPPAWLPHRSDRRLVRAAGIVLHYAGTVTQMCCPAGGGNAFGYRSAIARALHRMAKALASADPLFPPSMPPRKPWNHPSRCLPRKDR
jgi:hypothetical protein